MPINFTVKWSDLINDDVDETGDVEATTTIGAVRLIPLFYKGARALGLEHTPSPATFAFRTFTGYRDPDGLLKNKPGGGPLRVWANDPVFGLEKLPYRVEADLTDQLGNPVPFESFIFEAPATDTELDLTTVARVPIAMGSGLTRGPRGYASLWEPYDEGPPRVWRQRIVETGEWVGDPTTDPFASLPAVVAMGDTMVEARAAIGAAALTEGVAATWIETTDKQARPTRPSVVAIGDSITDSNYSATAWSGNSYSRTSSYLSMGYLNCAMVWNRQPATWFEVGINGQTSAQGLARFDTDVTPLLPQVMVESFATNDIFTGRTAAAVFADKLSMWSKAWAFGAKVIAANCPPRDTFTSGQKQEAHRLNEMLRKFAATNPTDFVLVDWYSVLADPLTGNYKTGYASDGVHPLTMASWAMGKAYEAALDQFIPGGVTNLATGANDVGNIAAGPLMTGSNGLIIANKGLTGTLASGWYAGSTGADTTLTSSLSNVTRSDGYGNWQQINTTVIPGVADTVTINQDVTTGWAVGDVVQACIEFETDATGWTNGKFDLNLLAVDESNFCYSIAGAFQPGETDVIVKFRPEQGILQTPPIIIPELTTKLQLRVSVGGLGIARFGRAAIRKFDTA